MHPIFLRNLIIVRNKNEIDHNNLRIALEHEAERDSIQNERVQEANGFINETGNERKLRTVTKVEDEELENIFNQVL